MGNENNQNPQAAYIEQMLLDFALSQNVGEWSIGEQAYQPTDVGSANSNIDLMKSKLGLIGDDVLGPLLAILGKTFDYSSLDDVAGEAADVEAAPNTDVSDQYRNSGFYDQMFIALENGRMPEDAAQAQWQHNHQDEAFPDIKAGEKGPPEYERLLGLANKVEGEVAQFSGWQRRQEQQASTPMVQSDLAKKLSSLGIPMGPTPDSYFSEGIDDVRSEQERTEKLYRRLLETDNPFSGQNTLPAAGLGTAPAPAPAPDNGGDGGKNAALQADITDIRFDADELTFENLFGDPGKWVDKTLDGWLNNQDGSNVSEEDQVRIADIESEREANRYGFGAEQTPVRASSADIENRQRDRTSGAAASSYDSYAAELEALGPFGGPRGGAPMGGMLRGETLSGDFVIRIEDAWFEDTGLRLPYEEIPKRVRDQYQLDIQIELGQIVPPGRLPGPEDHAWRDESGDLRYGGEPLSGPYTYDEYVAMMAEYRAQEEAVGGGPLSGPYTYDEYVAMMAEYRAQEEAMGGRATGGSQRGKGSIEDQYGESQRPGAGAPPTPWTLHPGLGRAEPTGRSGPSGPYGPSSSQSGKGAGASGPSSSRGVGGISGEKAREEALLQQILGGRAGSAPRSSAQPAGVTPLPAGWRPQYTGDEVADRAIRWGGKNSGDGPGDPRDPRTPAGREAKWAHEEKTWDKVRDRNSDSFKKAETDFLYSHALRSRDDLRIQRARAGGRTKQQDAVAEMFMRLGLVSGQ
jgi:hypothetical protein